LQKFIAVFKDKLFKPILIKKDEKIIDILPMPFQSYEEKEFIYIDSFTKGLQEFIAFEKQIKKEKSKYQTKIEKLKRQLVQQQNSIEKFKKKIEQKKVEGEVIYLNFQICDELLKEIALVLKQKEKKDKIAQINKKKTIKNFEPNLNECIVLLQDNQGNIREIKLDFRKTVSENAENAYLASKKYQEKLKGALEAIDKTKHQIKTWKKKAIVKTTSTIKHDKQFWFEQFRWFLSSEGNIVIAGRDAKSNDKLVKKYLKEGDRYIHADIHGAPSCIVKTSGINDSKIPISERTLDEACVFAGTYSKAWRQYGETQVYWVLPEQVSKTPQSGEFLPKGAFIVRGKRNYKKCKLEIAVGEIKLNNIKKIMGGHIDAVKKRSNNYVILIPGSIKKNSIAKKLSEIFAVPEQSIERVLPPGDVKIVRTVGFDI
jgi:predicted ribosome quality control (RQC) complex YloA/Tae2 family protein